jgi:hypothetical protein
VYQVGRTSPAKDHAVTMHRNRAPEESTCCRPGRRSRQNCIVATLWIESRAPSSGPHVDRLIVPERTDGDATANQPFPLGGEVCRHEVKVAHPVRRVGSNQVHRTCRFWRSGLDNPEFRGGMVVDVQRKAGLLCVKGPYSLT